MNNIERGWAQIVRRWPSSKSFRPLRDSFGMYGLNVVLNGTLGVFSVKMSTKTPREAPRRGVFLSCHSALCDHKVPVFILHKGVVWHIDPRAITSSYGFRNWLHGALMLNFNTVDVGARVVGSIDFHGGNVYLCIDCGKVMPDDSIRCERCAREANHG